MQVSDDMKDFFGAMTHLSVPDSMFGPVWRVEDLLDAMQGYDATGLAAKMRKRLQFGEARHECAARKHGSAAAACAFAWSSHGRSWTWKMMLLPVQRTSGTRSAGQRGNRAASCHSRASASPGPGAAVARDPMIR